MIDRNLDLGLQFRSGIRAPGANDAGKIARVNAAADNLEYVSLTLDSHTVANAPATAPAGRLIYVSDGDSGDPCLAVGDGATWRRIPLGTTIEAS